MSTVLTFFSGTDTNGREALWETDGTAKGTVEVAPLYGTSNKPYGQFTQVGSKILFVGEGSNGLTDLFVTDGTTGGTFELDPAGASRSLSLSPTDLASLGTKVLFDGIDTGGNYGLWVSDGTAAGTSEIAGTAGIDPRGMTTYNGKVLFAAVTGGGGLWSSDGTAAGTAMIAGTAALAPQQVTLFAGKAYFIDGKTGNLDVTDGTAAGTKALLHFGQVTDLTAVGASMVFEAVDTNGNYDLFKTDGTAGGTVEVAGTTGIFNTLVAASRDGNPISPDITVMNGKAYFEAASANGGFGLWVSDGTAAGTHEITGITGTLAAGIFPSPGDPDFNGPNFAVINNQLVFDGASPGGAAPSYGQTDLWVSNGTAGGTKELKGIAGGGYSSTLGLDPSNMTTLTLPAQPVVTGILFAAMPDAVDDGYIDIVGTAAAAIKTIKIYNGTTLLGTATRNGGSFSIGGQFAPGTYAALRAVATNASGQTVSQNAPFSIVTGLTGRPYTDIVNSLDPAGNLLGQTFYDQGNVYLADTVQHVIKGITVYLYQGGTYFETQRPLVAYAKYVSAGGVALGTSYFYANVQGKPYTGYELDVNAAGRVVRGNYTGVTTAAYSSYELDYVDGVKTATKYVFTDTGGAAYSSRETDYDFKNQLVAQKFVYTNVTGQFYTGRTVVYDGSNKLTSITYTGITNQAYSSREDDYKAGVYQQTKHTYTGIPGQAYTGREVTIASNGAIISDLYTGFTGTPYYGVERDYASGVLTRVVYDYTKVSGKSYYEYYQANDAAGHVLATTYFNNDTTHTMVGAAGNLTFTSISDDTMTGGGGGATFVFQPLYGHDTITDFSAHLTGAAHDTISLSTKEFADAQAVYAHAQNAGSNLVITGATGDTLTLLAMDKTRLAANLGDFTFHA